MDELPTPNKVGGKVWGGHPPEGKTNTDLVSEVPGSLDHVSLKDLGRMLLMLLKAQGMFVNLLMRRGESDELKE